MNPIFDKNSTDLSIKKWENIKKFFRVLDHYIAPRMRMPNIERRLSRIQLDQREAATVLSKSPIDRAGSRQCS
ncbi:MAG TPA: hypothetical protein PKC65_07580 [Pyrinomonadaceae bacterium]|nr:hypothetical protein [Pyrinomonadaceae bacterium]